MPEFSTNQPLSLWTRDHVIGVLSGQNIPKETIMQLISTAEIFPDGSYAYMRLPERQIGISLESFPVTGYSLLIEPR